MTTFLGMVLVLVTGTTLFILIRVVNALTELKKDVMSTMVLCTELAKLTMTQFDQQGNYRGYPTGSK